MYMYVTKQTMFLYHGQDPLGAKKQSKLIQFQKMLNYLAVFSQKPSTPLPPRPPPPPKKKKKTHSNESSKYTPTSNGNVTELKQDFLEFTINLRLMGMCSSEW